MVNYMQLSKMIFLIIDLASYSLVYTVYLFPYLLKCLKRLNPDNRCLQLYIYFFNYYYFVSHSLKGL